MGILTKTTAKIQEILDNAENTLFKVGDVANANAYGIIPVLIVPGASVLNSKTNSVGLNSTATPGRVLSVFGLCTVDPPDSLREGIGVDIHPILTATNNDQTLIGLWVDPSGPNGESQFNFGAFTGCRGAGIVNVQSFEQMGPMFLRGDVLGLNGGDNAVNFGQHGINRIMGIGNISGLDVQTHDVASATGASLLYGLQVEPVFLNTGAVGAITALSQYGLSVKATSHSVNANVLTNQYGLYVDYGRKDINTTLTNKYGIYIEDPYLAGQGLENYGIRNNGDFLQTKAAFFATTDWNRNTTTGSALRISLGASTGNTYSVIQAVSSGNNALNNLFLNPYGGLVGIGLVAATAILHLKASTAAANTASLKIDAGIVATTPVTGNIESDGTHLYWTDSGGTRRTLDNA